MFVTFLYMFRALYAHHQEARLCINLYTDQSLTDSDDTRCCINTIYPPDDEHIMLETCRGKGKAVPLQAWSGPEGSRKLRFPDYMTTAQDGGKV
jgi:hypothetical protein